MQENIDSEPGEAGRRQGRLHGSNSLPDDIVCTAPSIYKSAFHASDIVLFQRNLDRMVHPGLTLFLPHPDLAPCMYTYVYVYTLHNLVHAFEVESC